MIVFPLTGEAGFTVKYYGALLNSAQSLDSNLLHPPTQYYVQFTSGVTALAKGVLLTGDSSGATAIVNSVVTTVGTVTGAYEGILFLENISGTITAGENLQHTTTYCVTNTTQIDCQVWNCPAKSMFMTIETNTFRFLYNGQTPTHSTGTPASFGHPIFSNYNVEVVGIGNLQRFKLINAVSGTYGTAITTIKF